ncbi:MAG: O-antigen ligase family protein [Bacteroidia bacterium]|nr:MAG: O-antigen ligase family protein [Bacteroidia bacterium]
MSSKSDHNKKLMQAAIALLIAVSGAFAAIFVFPPALWLLIALFIAFLAYIIVHFRIESAFMKGLAFLLPFSLEFPFMSGSMLRVPTEPMIAVAAAILVLHVLRRPASIKMPVVRELAWTLPLITVFAVSTVFSSMPFVSFKFSFVNIIYLLVFYVLMMILSREKPGLFPQMLLFYGLGFLMVTLLSLYRFWQWDWNPIVLRGIFQPFYNDHTIFGASAAIMSIFWAAASQMERGAGWKLLSWILAGIFLTAVLLSGSRGALLSLAFAASVWLLFLLKPKPALIVLGFVVVLSGVWMLREPLADRFQQTEALSYDRESGLLDRTRSVGNVTTDVSNLERLNRWVSAWRMFLEKPLTGFGPGTYQFQYIPFQEPGLMNRLSVTNPWNVPEGSGGTAHSEYLLALSEMGVFGLLSWLLLMGRWSWLALRRWRSHPNRKQMMIALIALSTYFFHALVNNFLTTDKFAFLFWGTAAWLVSGHLYHEKDEVGDGEEGLEGLEGLEREGESR